MMKKRLLCLMMISCLALSACAPSPAPVEEQADPVATLSPAVDGNTPPVGDAALMAEETFALYLPDSAGEHLLCQYVPLQSNRGRHPAETVVRAILTRTVTPMPLTLVGNTPIEISGGVCTVHLSTSALLMDAREYYTLCLSLSATLDELPGIDAVNVLVAGQAPALDISGHLPAGCLLPSTAQTLPVLWRSVESRRPAVGASADSAPLTAACCLYFPLADGSGVMPEVRSLTFPGQSPAQLAQGLVNALFSGSSNPLFAPLASLSMDMTAAPEVIAVTGGARRITLHFPADLESRLRQASIEPACLYAALTCTLTTFIPSLQSVQIQAGQNRITSVIHPTFGSMLFPGGVMTRADYAPFILESRSLLFPRNGLLTPLTVFFPQGEAYSPRRILLKLFGDAPQNADRLTPEGLTDADILGLSVQGDTLLVHFSGRTADIIKGSGMDQQMMCRSITSALGTCLNVRRVRYYFGGEALSDLGQDVVWDGDFFVLPVQP